MHKDLKLRDPKTYAIIGAAMEVHNVMGPGFMENIYAECCVIEFSLREIPFVKEAPLPVVYKGHRVSGFYRADFICFDEIIVELKATAASNAQLDYAQMLNYLTATRRQHGLLVNFGGPRLIYKRFIMTPKGEATPLEVDP